MFFSATKLPKVDKLTSFNPTSKKYWTNNQIVPGNQFSNVKASTKPPTCNRSKIYKRKFSPVQHLWETFSFDIILAAPLPISFATILGEIRSLHRILQVLVNEPLTTTSIFSPEKFSLVAIETLLCACTCRLSSMTLWDSDMIIMKEDKIVVFFNERIISLICQ